MITKAFCLLVILLSLIGCSSFQDKEKKKYQLRSPETIDKEEFDKKHYDISYIANKNACVTSILLSQPGGIIRFELPLDPFTEIQSLQLIASGASDNLRLKRFLLRGEEYYWDQNAKKLLVRLNIPSTYLIRAQAMLNLKIAGVDDNGSHLIERRFNIFWRPLDVKASQQNKGEAGKQQNVFFTSLAEAHQEIADQSNKFKVQQIVMDIFKDDLAKTNVGRMANSYCQELTAIAESFDAGEVKCGAE